MLDPLVTTYVDAAIAQLRRKDLMRRPRQIPPQMRDPSVTPSGDWCGWQPIDSTVTDADLIALEQETRLEFPPLYRDFLRYKHFLALTERGVRFERHSPLDWKKALR